MKSKNWSPIFYLLFALALASLELTSCAKELQLQKPPTATRINLSNEGVIAKFDLEVDEHWVYNFAIRFRYQEGNQTERSRIRAIIGGYEVDKNNNPTDPGVPTPIRLTITKKQENLPSYQKSITPILTSWGGDAYAKGSESFTKNIGHCDLTPGKYTVLLESLAHPKEYESVPTFFLIGMDKFKTSFNPKNIDRSKTCPQ
ncbi:DUF5625 family protein [Xanthomonas oryzae]|uniref:DUF5625 family protein n=1 Tax=Xanthomonas oryzae TaxID=347 RepID=UPI0011F2CC60|nr:DUF5625 family protein [Xanthomonas oryzae]QEO97241.1 hypothetical protein XOCgx_2249 [Xanthomonas oryzae pv. oryzicola]QGH65977.1 hypothetical protein GHV42_09995 [Xanthomonas oryzae pv. oryzicola]UBB94660.1 hypothetical protein K2I41_10150 [Xanthomonas oryzae pv. oryzicola]WGY42630.1 hypothetical protein HED68_09865 [Xanthomonas oryzae pv. oryzicola]